MNHKPGLELAFALVVWLGAAVSALASDDSVTWTPPSSTYGEPETRVSGATRGERGCAPPELHLDVMGPQAMGLTTKAQPTLYWHATKAADCKVQLTIEAVDADEPLVELVLSAKPIAGFNSYSLGGGGARLRQGVAYNWSIAYIVDPEQRSKDVTASGRIKLVGAPAGMDLANGSALSRAQSEARAGFWYDAFSELSAAIAASSKDQSLQSARSALLRQVGLDAAVSDPGM